MEYNGKIQAWGKATAVITVQSDHDVSEMAVSLFTVLDIKFIQPLSTPVGAKLINQSDQSYTWIFNAVANEEYTFTA